MNNQSTVRVRFAPSPTGHLHIGGLRTALFNWLFARHNKGAFLLRIEDTDLERSKQEYLDAILHAMTWAKIDYDEDLVIQSSRIEEHKEVIAQLVKEKKAYRCYCMPAEVEARLAIAHADLEHAKYDGYCRNRAVTPDLQNKLFVIRFALPDVEKITFDDLIRGPVTFNKEQFDDFIIARSDGTPMYNFVVVVDDAFMRITHVIRGEDHISNTPKQIMLYQACGYAIPRFAHLPLILGKSGLPLSKRDAATSVMEYQQLGYLPDALINYLARLGWAHGDQEIFTREELIRYFSLDHVGKKGSVFDMTKLGWVNSMYMRELPDQALLEQIKEIRPRFEAELSKWNDVQILALIALYKQRTKTIIELADELKSLYERSTPYLVEDISAWVTQVTIEHLKAVANALEDAKDFSLEAVTQTVKDCAKQYDLKIVNLAQPIRIALLGKASGPAVFELIALLGKEETVKRIRAFVAFLDTNKPLK